MAFWLYALKCADDSFYAGHTDALPRRIAEHEHGQIEGYTSSRRPLRLVYAQDFETREQALAAERQVKRWSRCKKQALIAGDWAGLKRAAKKDFGQAP